METITGASNEEKRPVGSPAAWRTVCVLDLFADHPGESFTLTEIARALKMSTATCLSILAALVSANYLVRDSTKRYFVGPALGRLAAAAEHGVGNALSLAKPEMRTLADRFDVICSAIFPVNGEAVVRERASSVSHLGWVSQLGRRFPLSPPFGTVFYAWAEKLKVDRWVASSADTREAISQERIRSSLDFVRDHGFAVGLRTGPSRDDGHLKSLPFRTADTDYLVAELSCENEYNLAFVSAPVFDADGNVVFALALLGFEPPTHGAQILAIGAELRAACSRITRAAGGRATN